MLFFLKSTNIYQTTAIDFEQIVKLMYRLSLQVGENLIQNFLDKAKSLPVATMSEEEVKAELRRMKQELVANNNAYISEILARCVPAKTA